MGLGLEAEVQVQQAGSGALGRGLNFSVLIDGKHCRVERQAETVGCPAPREAAARIAETLYWNRELFLTEAAVRPAYRQYLDSVDAGNAMSLDAFLRFAVARAADGFSLPESVSLLQAWRDGPELGYTPNYELESLCASRFAKTVKVQCSARVYHTIAHEVQSSAVELPARVKEMLSLMRQGLFYKLGIRFPEVSFEFSEDLDGLEFRAWLNDLRGPVRTTLAPDEILVNDVPTHLQLLGIKARPAVNPGNLSAAAIANPSSAQLCDQARLTTWDGAEYLVLALSRELRRHAAEFLTAAQVEYALLQLDQAFSMLTFNILERYSMLEVREVLAALVEEGVSIRDLRSILEALQEISGSIEADFSRHLLFMRPGTHLLLAKPWAPARDQRLAFVRAALKSQITQSCTSGQSTLAVCLLSPEIEDRIQRTSTEPLAEQERERLIAAFAKCLIDIDPVAFQAVILTRDDLRRTVRELVSQEFPNLTILAHQELAQGLNVHHLKRIE